MSKPNINIPAEFAPNGVRTPFSNAKVQNGFDRINPDVFAGDNLNQFIDDTYKGLNGVLELYEGCVLYDSTVTYTNKSLVFDITNDGIKFYHSLQNGNINHALTDADYWEEVNLGGSSRNVGEIISSTLPLTDAGLHLLDGSLLQYGIYKEFIDYIADLYAENPSANYFTTESAWQSSVSTYGSCGKFVYDNVNQTVRLPKITGFTEGTIDPTVLGDLVEAGLPNITGYVEKMLSNTGSTGSASGAFTKTRTYYGDNYSGSGNGSENTLDFRASRSSSIYGNASTVQPQAIKVLYYIVLATSTKTDIQVDIDEIATDLNGKADVDLINTNNQAKILMASMGMPSNTVTSLSTGTSNTTYTAPANGYFNVQLTTGSNSGNTMSHVERSDGLRLFGTSSNYANGGVLMPVLKGQKIKVWYQSNVTFSKIYFIYAKGSESEAS